MLHGRTDVVKVMLPNLTYHNAIANNKDGHGYFVVPKMIWRTVGEGNEAVFKDQYMIKLRLNYTIRIRKEDHDCKTMAKSINWGSYRSNKI